MIINYSHRFVFIHAPKTAGTSVSNYLSRFTGPEDLDIIQPLSPLAQRHCNEFGLRKHTSAQEILEFLGPVEFDALFKFGFVRNPFERIYSLYKFLKFNWRSWPGSQIMDHFPTLQSFLASEFFTNAATSVSPDRDRIDRLFLPQVFWLCDAHGHVLANFVGRMERFETDFAQICSRIGLPRPGPLLEQANIGGEPQGRVALRSRILARLGLRPPVPPRAQGVQPSLQDAFGHAESRRIVLDLYASDFTTFCYATELPRSLKPE